MCPVESMTRLRFSDLCCMHTPIFWNRLNENLMNPKLGIGICLASNETDSQAIDDARAGLL
jgi:hypothetical protein